MLNQRIIDIYRFVEKTISPSNLALEELFFMSKLKMIKNKDIHKKPFKETENSQNFEGVNSMLMYLLNKESSDCS